MDKINFYYWLLIAIFLTGCQNLSANDIMPYNKAQPIKTGQIVANNGLLYRKVIAVNPDNSYQVQNFYNDTHTKQSDVFTISNKNNLPIFQELYIYNLRNLIFQGALTLWTRDGKKMMTMMVYKGKAEGLFTKYHTDTGNKEIEGYHFQGKPDGLWIYSAPDGSLEKKIYYKEGIAQWVYESPSIRIQTP